MIGALHVCCNHTVKACVLTAMKTLEAAWCDYLCSVIRHRVDVDCAYRVSSHTHVVCHTDLMQICMLNATDATTMRIPIAVSASTRSLLLDQHVRPYLLLLTVPIRHFDPLPTRLLVLHQSFHRVHPRPQTPAVRTARDLLGGDVPRVRQHRQSPQKSARELALLRVSPTDCSTRRNAVRASRATHVTSLGKAHKSGARFRVVLLETVDLHPREDGSALDQALLHELLKTRHQDPVDGLWRWKADVFFYIGAVDKRRVQRELRPSNMRQLTYGSCNIRRRHDEDVFSRLQLVQLGEQRIDDLRVNFESLA